jgi:hypothetical protein
MDHASLPIPSPGTKAVLLTGKPASPANSSPATISKA